VPAGTIPDVQTNEHLDHLRADGVRLADAADLAGLDAPVPRCPGWSLRDLVGHLTGVHRWARLFVTTGRGHPTGDAEDAELFAVPPDDELMATYRSGHEALCDALDAAPTDLSSWTFLPGLTPRAFWARRQAHETAVHRTDAEAAAGVAPVVAPALAADGVDELLGMLARPRGRLVADPPVSLAVRPTDLAPGAVDGVADGWTMDIGPDARQLHREVRDADCTVSGPSDTLYRLLWNRIDRSEVLVIGDEQVLDLWRSRATVVWG
jgi:uncharacterized protein (TIGR03083 family)